MVSKVIDYFDRPSSIFFAVCGNNPTRLAELLGEEEHKKEIDHPFNTQGNHTPLFFACYGDAQVEIADLLLTNGANPLLRDIIGRTPLHIAANTADPKILQRLLAEPGVANFVDHPADLTGQTPFHALCLPGSGAGPTKKGHNADVVACFNMLLAQSKNTPQEVLFKRDSNGLTPLMLAKHYGHTELLAAFKEIVGQEVVDAIELPANMDDLLKVDFYGRTPLLEAAFVNNKDIVQQELAKGEDPNNVNIQSGRNAFQLACCGISDGDMISLLLPYMKNPMAPDHKERTALHFAANTGRKDTVDALLTHPRVCENINVLDAEGRTALHALAMAGSRAATRAEVIQLLFDLGIDFDRRDNNDDTALDIAKQRGNTAVADKIKACMETRAVMPTQPPAFDQDEAGSAFLPRFAMALQLGAATPADPAIPAARAGSSTRP